jgi:membrane-anchored mycosin MYCP
MSQPTGENQLVVDTRDLRSIAAELTSMDIGFGDLAGAPEIPALNVAMMTLSDVDRVGLQPDAGPAREQLVAGGPAIGHTDPPTDLAVLMAVLRERFATKYHRAPRMGRNRDMEAVGGLPHWAAAPANLPEVVDEAVVLRPERSVPGPGLRVGVLDTAMFANASLKGRFTSDDFVSDELPRPAWAGHATFIVGRILRRAPGADVVVRKVLEGKFGTATAWQLAEGMASFLGTGIEVLNLSLGCFSADDEPPFLLRRATEALLAEMIVVAAAGNHGEKLYPMVARDNDGKPEFRPDSLHTYSPMWPAAIPGVVAVGAATVREENGTFTMERAAFTPENVPWIELWAPGVDVVSTFLEGDVRTITWEPDGGDWGTGALTRTVHEWDFKSGAAKWSGTSMAAGDVTGEIAAVAQADGISARQALAKIMRRQGGPMGPDDVRSWV